MQDSRAWPRHEGGDGDVVVRTGDARRHGAISEKRRPRPGVCGQAMERKDYDEALRRFQIAIARDRKRSGATSVPSARCAASDGWMRRKSCCCRARRRFPSNQEVHSELAWNAEARPTAGGGAALGGVPQALSNAEVVIARAPSAAQGSTPTRTPMHCLPRPRWRFPATAAGPVEPWQSEPAGGVARGAGTRRCVAQWRVRRPMILA